MRAVGTKMDTAHNGRCRVAEAVTHVVSERLENRHGCGNKSRSHVASRRIDPFSVQGKKLDAQFPALSPAMYTTASTLWNVVTQPANLDAVNGVLWSKSIKAGIITRTSTDLCKMANVVFNEINNSGDIMPWM